MFTIKKLIKDFNSFSNTGFDSFEEFFNYFDTYIDTKVKTKDTSNDYTVIVEVPGLTSKDVEVSAKNETLYVKYSGKTEKIYIPFDVDLTKITAKVENGLLTVVALKNVTVKGDGIKVDVK